MDIKEKLLKLISNCKNRIMLVLGILIIFSASLIFVFNVYHKEEPKLLEEPIISLINEEEKEPELNSKIMVDIKGHVKNPGVYEVNANSRVTDVISSSGGLKLGASTKYINLSKKVTDEMVIIIHSNDEIEEFQKTNVAEEECICETSINDVCAVESYSYFSSINEVSEEKSQNLININEASIEELMALPGIGESKAKAIIEYREASEFNDIEDIMEVSGIGESIFIKIKDLIITK